jgi:beta-glucanase (GH16 family)
MRKLQVFVIALLAILQALPACADSAPQSDTLSFADTIETLKEDFQKAPIWQPGAVQVNASIKPLSDPTFSWAAGYIWDHPPAGMKAIWPPPDEDYPAWTSNNTADADPNGDMIAQIGPSRTPLSWAGTLNFSAQKMPADLAATIGKSDPHDYMGSSISSFPYAQRYGIFAMSAKLPKGPGVWPAFWLVPSDKSWPPEIDIMEVIGHTPTILYTTLHMNGPNGHVSQGHGTDTHMDLGAAFHEYAVDWGPEKINWYFDRKLVFSQPTPFELHKPCYIIANLGIGRPNDWGGAPDDTTILPATMQVAYIKAWQRPSYIGEP